MPSLSDRLAAAIGTTRPSRDIDEEDRRPDEPSRMQQRLAEAAWRERMNERRRQLIAKAESDPDVAAILAALPGARVSEVRIRPLTEEVPPPPHLAAQIAPADDEEPAAAAVDADGLSVIDEPVTPENDATDENLAVAENKVAESTSCVSDENETPTLVPTWPRRVSPRRLR